MYTGEPNLKIFTILYTLIRFYFNNCRIDYNIFGIFTRFLGFLYFAFIIIFLQFMQRASGIHIFNYTFLIIFQNPYYPFNFIRNAQLPLRLHNHPVFMTYKEQTV